MIFLRFVLRIKSLNFRKIMLLVTFALAVTSSSADVVCEKIGVCWETKCCQMNLETKIESNDVAVSWPRDDTIELIWLTGNRRIEYLPVEVYRNFPKIGFYWAGHCAIKEISKKNFEQLKSLKWAALQDNQIEKISSNTFEGLDELRQVFLGNIPMPQNQFSVTFESQQGSTESNS